MRVSGRQIHLWFSRASELSSSLLWSVLFPLAGSAAVSSTSAIRSQRTISSSKRIMSSLSGRQRLSGVKHHDSTSDCTMMKNHLSSGCVDLRKTLTLCDASPHLTAHELLHSWTCTQLCAEQTPAGSEAVVTQTAPVWLTVVINLLQHRVFHHLVWGCSAEVVTILTGVSWIELNRMSLWHVRIKLNNGMFKWCCFNVDWKRAKSYKARNNEVLSSLKKTASKTIKSSDAGTMGCTWT